MYQLKAKSIVTKCFHWVDKDGGIWYWDIGENAKFNGNEQDLNKMIDRFKSAGYTEFEIIEV